MNSDILTSASGAPSPDVSQRGEAATKLQTPESLGLIRLKRLRIFASFYEPFVPPEANAEHRRTGMARYEAQKFLAPRRNHLNNKDAKIRSIPHRGLRDLRVEFREFPGPCFGFRASNFGFLDHGLHG